MKSFIGMTRQAKTRFRMTCERNDEERSENIAEEYGANVAGAMEEQAMSIYSKQESFLWNNR